MAAQRIGCLLLLLFGLGGCASVNLTAGFPEVSATVEERSAKKIVWNRGTDLDKAAAEQVRSLLQGKLTADDAVQIAMLNNAICRPPTPSWVWPGRPGQGGLFKNPILDAAVFFPLTGARPDFQLSVVFGFLDAFYVPLRKRVAATQFEEARLKVTGAVLDFAAQVRTAFHVHQANEQLLELRQTIVQALAASLEVSRRLHEAGNISDLDLARDRAQTEATKVALRSAEVASRQSREQLNSLMGAWGEETRWQIDGRMPDIPAERLQGNGLERVALDRSIGLSHARQRIIAAGQQLGLEQATALLPDLELGPGAEREGDEAWKLGPVLSVPIPLFDQGQGRIGRAVAELRRAQQEYYALAVRIRATARAIQDRIEGAQDQALYYRDILLPLRERIVNEAQLHYNAMQIGTIQLLRDREQQIETGVAYVETLREYWLARADLAQIASGRLPTAVGARVGGVGGPIKKQEGH